MSSTEHEVENIDVCYNSDETEDSCDETPLIGSFLEDGTFPKTRHIFGLISFVGFAIIYAMRVNLSVAIVIMVNHTAIPHEDEEINNETCTVSSFTNNTTPEGNGTFVWDEVTQGIVLGSFFYGYVLTQVPGGRLAEKFGGKMVYGFGVLLTAVFTILTPPAAYWNLPALVLVRVLEGMAEGVTYPAMHVMLAHWIPPLERNKFAAVVYAGSNVGTVLSLPITGWLCSVDFLGGWPLAFYIFGFLGFIWFLFWIFLVFDTPSSHPYISWNEKNYIERQMRNSGMELSEDDATCDIPWCAILKSGPLWGILITQCGQSWAFYTQLTELPTYMNNILHFSIESNASLNALPYLTSWIGGILCSMCADWMLEKEYISLKNSYKLWNSIAAIVPSLGLCGVAWVGCNWLYAMLILTIIGAFTGAAYPGNQINHIALSPKFAGTLYGFTNAAANTCGFLAPYVTGVIISGHQTLAQWQLVFYLAAGINIGTNFVYLLLASDKEQSWSINCQPHRRRRAD